jgi:hypothetical protein
MLLDLQNQYEKVKEAANIFLATNDVSRAISELDLIARSILTKCDVVKLESPAPKQYIAFLNEGRISRPVNERLFNLRLGSEYSSRYINNNFSGLSHQELTSLLYTISMSYCAASDVLTDGNKKSPATFFEKFIGNIFARELNVHPITALEMLNDEPLATDYIYKSGEGKANIHLQIKITTRERAIEAWSHQRILDGIFGVGSYIGILACMSETNIVKRKSIVEVCVPGQWALYQKYIARMHRIYYLDVPIRTEGLGQKEPYIQVKHLSEFFYEKERLLSPSLE